MSETAVPQINFGFDFFDAPSLYRVCEALRAESDSPPRVQYDELLRVCQEKRLDYQFHPADITIAALAVDEDSDKHEGFVSALSGMGILTHTLNYHWTQVGSVAGGTPISSVSPQASYLLGLLAGRRQRALTIPPSALTIPPSAIIVTGDFSVFHAMLDFSINRGGQAVLAFFKSQLDPQWDAAGLFDVGCPIQFVNLDIHAEELLGVNIVRRRLVHWHSTVSQLAAV
jgi:hypothetical protein